ncbi:MAG: hypothetical protein PHG03_03255 [Bacilli bacterium]|nr:hypothetical protein [Bacilli bacterium]MDD4795559.1 hypothetical protein [Bacilli bacterium]
MEVMYIKKIDNNYFKNKNIIGLVGEYSDLLTLVNNPEKISINFNQTVKRCLGKEIRLIEKFSLNEDIINKKIKNLSLTELKILTLIKIIEINPELIILNDFEIGINEKYSNTIIKFLKNINTERNIKIVVLSNNPLFLNKITKTIIIMKNNIIKYQGEILPAITSGLLPKPEIIKFIDLANEKGAGLDYTLDGKELLKDIYRSVY